MASNCRARACASQASQGRPQVCASRAACVGGQARITRSNTASSTRQPDAVKAKAWTRRPKRTSPPRCATHASAASGSSALRSARGSSRLEPPECENSASRSTRKNIWALARSAGVFSADTHSGSIRPAITAGLRNWHSCATDRCGAQRKPAHCQRTAACISNSLSRQVQPRTPAMPTSASSGVGSWGSFRPVPSGNCMVSGSRSSEVSVSTPTSRIKRRVSL